MTDSAAPDPPHQMWVVSLYDTARLGCYQGFMFDVRQWGTDRYEVETSGRIVGIYATLEEAYAPIEAERDRLLGD